MTGHNIAATTPDSFTFPADHPWAAVASNGSPFVPARISAKSGRPSYDIEYKFTDRWSVIGEYDRFDQYNLNLKWEVVFEVGRINWAIAGSGTRSSLRRFLIVNERKNSKRILF
jgi:hypothetical protein